MWLVLSPAFNSTDLFKTLDKPKVPFTSLLFVFVSDLRNLRCNVAMDWYCWEKSWRQIPKYCRRRMLNSNKSWIDNTVSTWFHACKNCEAFSYIHLFFTFTGTIYTQEYKPITLMSICILYTFLIQTTFQNVGARYCKIREIWLCKFLKFCIWTLCLIPFSLLWLTFTLTWKLTVKKLACLIYSPTLQISYYFLDFNFFRVYLVLLVIEDNVEGKEWRFDIQHLYWVDLNAVLSNSSLPRWQSRLLQFTWRNRRSEKILVVLKKHIFVFRVKRVLSDFLGHKEFM